MKATLSADGSVLTIRVPMRLQRRGGRKRIIAPDGSNGLVARRREPESALIKALARAHRWKAMLESREYTSIAELAVAEKVGHSYVCRILRLTLLAPDIVEATLDGRQPKGLSLADLMGGFPAVWAEQRARWGLNR